MNGKWKRCLCAVLTALFFGAYAPAPAAGAVAMQDRKVIAFGDSITASGKWFAEAETSFGIKILNRSTGGWNSKQGRAAFGTVLAEKPDLLLLSFGMNDASLDMEKYVPLEEYRENMADMIERALASGAQVLLVIENPIGNTLYYTRHDETVFEPYGGADAFYFQYIQAARELARTYGLIVADNNSAFRETGDPERYIADGVHPNDAGYRIYSKQLCNALFRLELGDLDGDGELGVTDYLLLKKHVLETGSAGDRARFADLNADGEVDFLDYLFLKRCILKERLPGAYV